ncbi:YnfA family protein [Brucella gallinifaecis]|uniref:YnfA family protein n=1 Tax=Brucella gallinifaecis TaxID=215590 RepID=A0A502BP83_9HYPH|nr:YnfA family protein [Brucella gallinifaecis]TPF75096.1 YnfA family protein [Brucella gallinifaecis]
MQFLIYTTAAIFEIAGCFSFWAWLKLDKSPLWLLPGILCLALFAYLLTLIESSAAGRAYAAYGGIYIIASIVWIWAAEGMRPDRWDIIGAIIAFTGTCIILFTPRT